MNVSLASALYAAHNVSGSSNSAPAAPPASSASLPQDTVSLHSQAPAAGDVDHDGDSH